MREIFLGMLAASGVGAGVYLWPAGDVPANVYALSPAEAVKRLSSVSTRTGTAPFFDTELTVATTGTDRVDFINADGTVVCKVYILPADGGLKVSPTCSEDISNLGIEQDTAGRTATKLLEDGFAELVDSALDGRPFNKTAVTVRTVRTMNDNLGAMQRETLETQREFEQLEADLETNAYYDGAAAGGYGPEAVDGGYGAPADDSSGR